MFIKSKLFYMQSIFILFSFHGLYSEKQHFSRIIMNKTAYPFITGDVFRNLCHHNLHESPFDPKLVEEGDLIFAGSTNLNFLFSKIDEIPNKFILITHLTPKTHCEKYRKFLDNPKLIAWFTKNSDGSHPKLHYLPNGVGRVGKKCIIGNFEERFGIFRSNIFYCSATKKYHLLNESFSNRLERKHLLSSNFTMTYNKVDRQPVYDLFKEKEFCTTFPFIPYEEYIQTLLTSTFILSPRGSSIDCYRTWEAMACGSIPIVLSSFLDSEYKDLPIVIVNSWDMVTKNFLAQKARAISEKHFNYEKLLCDYWIKKIIMVRDINVPKAKKPIIDFRNQNKYFGFDILPYKLEIDSRLWITTRKWVHENNITNALTSNLSAAIPLAEAIPSYGCIVVVADLSDGQKQQFLSNVLQLYLGHKIVLLTKNEWQNRSFDYKIPTFE